MKYGCNNRAEYVDEYWVPDGHFVDDAYNLITKANPVTTFGKPDCQYTLTELGKTDTRCNECKWRKQ